MPSRTMHQTMDDIGTALLIDLDDIARAAHARYGAYAAADRIELDVRAQAACTYAHMVAEADRRFFGKPGVRVIEIRGLKLWHFEDPNVVVRLKKMDEDGRSRNYPTKQARAFDQQMELPGLPLPPVRLTAGYLLDATGTDFVRSQIARPDGREPMWCGAILPKNERVAGQPMWTEVTRQARMM